MQLQRVRITDDDRLLLDKVFSLLEPDQVHALSSTKLRELVSAEVLPLLDGLDSVSAAEELFGLTVGHPNPIVRSSMVPFVCSWLPYPIASESLVALVADPDDVVCLPAIRACGDYGVEYVIPYLASIVGWPSMSRDTPSKPVGLGAAHVQYAFTRLLGTQQFDALESARYFFERHDRMPDQFDIEYPIDLSLSDSALSSHPEMVPVQGGTATVGLPPDSIPDRTFGWQDAAPARRVWLPPFLIDRYPVTNAEYDRFCAEIAAEGHLWCHPEEPEDKDHTRNTISDARFASDHPAAGVDWYDAYAYSHWADKELPTEHQWERAARGPDGRRWPWGEEWDPSLATWAGSTFGRPELTLDAWRDLLTSFGPDTPTGVTTPVNEHEGGASRFGAVDMVGNCWEWTKSDALTRRFFTPSQKIAASRMLAVTLKGGAWSSLPGLMFPSYRGRDAPTCRHNEIGFRCVKNLDYRRVAPAAASPVNPGVY